MCWLLLALDSFLWFELYKLFLMLSQQPIHLSILLSSLLTPHLSQVILQLLFPSP